MTKRKIFLLSTFLVIGLLASASGTRAASLSSTDNATPASVDGADAIESGLSSLADAVADVGAVRLELLDAAAFAVDSNVPLQADLIPPASTYGELASAPSSAIDWDQTHAQSTGFRGSPLTLVGVAMLVLAYFSVRGDGKRERKTYAGRWNGQSGLPHAAA